MKKVLVSLFFIVTGSAFAQQLNLNSQYLFNDMLVNPGATGSKDYVPIQLNFRKQWANFIGSPTTQFISAEGKIAKNMGLGGVIFNDISGPSRRTGISINSAYQLQLDANRRHFLGMGIAVSFVQHMIDQSKITTYLPNDPAVARGYNNAFVPDASFGFFYRFLDKGYVGVSAYNLIQTKVDLFKVGNKIYNPLVRTYYLYGGYNFSLGQKSKIKTSTLLRVIETGVFQFDVSAIYEWNKIFWVGGSYRFKSAAVAMAGVQIKMVKIGYSYDFTLSDIKKYSTGSHEIFLELQLNSKNNNGGSGTRTPWLKRNKIYSPRM